jgi:serine protease Do
MHHHPKHGPGVLCALALILLPAAMANAASSFATTVADVQPRIVKIYGAGGFRGLEHYQSGFLISPSGHVLTVWSYVLDVDSVMVVLDDGRRLPAELVGSDPRLEIAVLKIQAEGLPCFELGNSVSLAPGERVLAFSNLFGVAAGDEDASVQHGHVSAVSELAARRGTFATLYRGPAYVLDAMTNNPGAAGGALTNRSGQLAGLLGKELRNQQDNTWLNYALPVAELTDAVNDILAGKVRPRGEETGQRKPPEAVSLRLLGIVLVPNVLPKTPPFVERVVAGSPADEAGLVPDDLLLMVNSRMASSIAALEDELSSIDRIDEVRLLVQRGQELVEVSLFAPR